MTAEIIEVIDTFFYKYENDRSFESFFGIHVRLGPKLHYLFGL